MHARHRSCQEVDYIVLHLLWMAENVIQIDGAQLKLPLF